MITHNLIHYIDVLHVYVIKLSLVMVKLTIDTLEPFPLKRNTLKDGHFMKEKSYNCKRPLSSLGGPTPKWPSAVWGTKEGKETIPVLV